MKMRGFFGIAVAIASIAACGSSNKGSSDGEQDAGGDVVTQPEGGQPAGDAGTTEAGEAAPEPPDEGF